MNNKTVVDAVNYLQGDLSNINITAPTFAFNAIVKCIKSFNNHINGNYYDYSDNNRPDLADEFEFICTIEEFNQCIAEMSEGLFVPDCRPQQPEIQYDKDGNGWEVGAVYEFSNDQKDWYQASFSRIDKSLSEYKPNGLNWHLFARECQSPIGKIHKKPVELVDGAAYQFDFNKCTMVGFYHEGSERFREMNAPCAGVVCDLKDATNIIRLVPEVK